MKKLSKIVALLLAGALTMLLFTACGGGSFTPTSDVEKAEALYMDAFNTALGTNYENDADLEKLAKQVLDDSLNEDGTLKNGKGMIFSEDAGNSVYRVVTILAQQGNKKVPYGITSEELTNKDKVIVNVDQTTKKVTTGLAVGAVKKGDKVYVAIAMTKDMNLMK